MAFDTDIYKSASYPWYEDDLLDSAYCARGERIPTQTWYGTSFGLLLEYMTNFKSIDVSNYENIGDAFQFSTINLISDMKISFNTYAETVSLQTPFQSGKNMMITSTNVRLFWGWGSARKFHNNYNWSEETLCSLPRKEPQNFFGGDNSCGQQKYIHMNPDWGSQSNYYVGIPTQYSEITLKKDTSYVLIFHKDTLDGSGINKPQFWAVLHNTNDISNFDVPLQKHKGGSKYCYKSRTSFDQAEAKKLRNKGYPFNCGVPSEEQNTCS